MSGSEKNKKKEILKIRGGRQILKHSFSDPQHQLMAPYYVRKFDSSLSHRDGLLSYSVKKVELPSALAVPH
jgi:hypothetical protein